MNQDPDRDLSQLYRASAAEEPPQWLDRRITQAARSEMRRSPLRALFHTLSGWRMAVGALAVVTLSVSLVTVMNEEAPSVLAPTVTVQPSAESRVAAEQEPSDPRLAPSDSTARSQVQAPRPVRQEESARDGGRGFEDHAAVQKSIAVEEAPLAKQGLGDASKSVEPRVPVAAPTVEQPAVAAAPSAPAPPQARRTDVSRQGSNVGEAVVLGRTSRREAVPAPASPTPAADESPETWLKRLSELLQQGREQEVRAGLERFRQRYPDFALPENLRRFTAEGPGNAPIRPREGESFKPMP